MNLRGCKGVESKARPRRNCSLQYAVANCKSQVTQVNAVTSQVLTLRGNKCLILVEVQKGLYTKVYDYFLSDSKHVRDNLLNFLTSPCLRQTHPCWRATAIWSAMNWDLRLCQ